MRLWFSSIMLLLVSFQVSAWTIRKDTTEFEGTLLSNATGDMYQLKSNSLTLMRDDLGVELTFSEPINGTVTWADVSNPLRLLLFYQDVSRVIILDNRLGEVGRIDLLSQDLGQVVGTAIATRGGIWVFDETNMELARLNGQGEIVQRSGPLLSNLSNYQGVIGLWENAGRVSLLVEGEGLLQFDLYGTYLRTIPLKDASWGTVVDGLLIFQNTEGLFAQNLEDLSVKKIDRVSENVIAGGEIGEEFFVQTVQARTFFKP